jgi:peptide/nickel transport system permease protein
MAVSRYFGGRVVLAVVTLLLIATITFFATNAIPGDPARAALGRFATPQELTLYRQQQDLTKPVIERFVVWLGHLFSGSWGDSVVTRTPVSGLIGDRLLRTLILSLGAMLIAVPLSFAIGVYTGLRSGEPLDVGVSVGALFVNSLPEFVVGLVLIVVLGVEAKLLPIESSGALFGSGWAQVKAYILPMLTLAIVLAPYMIRVVRVNVREVATQPFVRSAILRGASRRRVVWRHVVPNASIPVVNVIALTMAELIGGVVVTESVFGFPGIGQLLVTSVSNSDFPTVQALALILGLGYVLANFIADAVVVALNPRLRRS